MDQDEILEQLDELITKAHEMGVEKVEIEDLVEGIYES